MAHDISERGVRGHHAADEYRRAGRADDRLSLRLRGRVPNDETQGGVAMMARGGRRRGGGQAPLARRERLGSGRARRCHRANQGDQPRKQAAWHCQALRGVDVQASAAFVLDPFDAMKLNYDLPKILDTPHDVLSMLEPLIADLEARLDAAEA